jgi:uncharacterized membrane protein
MLTPILLFAGTGLLFVGLAVPLMRRRIRPNALYGLRVPATLADEAVWYEANARSGRDLLVFGFLVVGLAVVLPLSSELTTDSYALVMTVFLIVGALLTCLVGWRRANRLLAERRA